MAADETHAPVHDHVFAVVAEVEPPAFAPAADGAEGGHLETALPPLLDHGWLHRGAAEAVEEKANLDAFRRLGGERFEQAQAEAVFAHDVKLDEDAMPRGRDFGEDGIEGFLAVDEQAELVAAQIFLARDGGDIGDPRG